MASVTLSGALNGLKGLQARLRLPTWGGSLFVVFSSDPRLGSGFENNHAEFLAAQQGKEQHDIRLDEFTGQERDAANNLAFNAAPQLSLAAQGPAEVRDLIRAFNHMTERVQRAALRQREFVSGAAHELRSPLTALLLRLEMLAAHPPTAQELPRQIEALLATLHRLRNAVDQLLLLASMEEQERVFERFYRSPRARSDASGHGLGLAIVRELVRLNGGAIRLESAPGRGACFRVTFPR